MTPDHENQPNQNNDARSGEIPRRDFVGLSVAVGIAATAGSAAAALEVVETSVTIKTPDGTCDAAFIYPQTGSHPGVLIWTDAFGLRPAFREMAKRLAAEGYAVLVPNPFYRVAKAPVFTDVAAFNFQNPDDRAKLGPLMGSVNAAGAAASSHGGGLVTDKPDSPHLLAPKIKARMYFGVASNDDRQQPDAKDKLKEAFAAAQVPAEIEVYAGLHGWCVPNMPQQNGAPLYNRADAERAWGKLLELYKTALS